MYMLLDPTSSHSSALEILSHNIQDSKVTTSDCKEDFLRLTKTQTPRANAPVSLKQGLQIQLSEIIHLAALFARAHRFIPNPNHSLKIPTSFLVTFAHRCYSARKKSIRVLLSSVEYFHHPSGKWTRFSWTGSEILTRRINSEVFGFSPAEADCGVNTDCGVYTYQGARASQV